MTDVGGGSVSVGRRQGANLRAQAPVAESLFIMEVMLEPRLHSFSPHLFSTKVGTEKTDQVQGEPGCGDRP